MSPAFSGSSSLKTSNPQLALWATGIIAGFADLVDRASIELHEKYYDSRRVRAL